MKKKCFLLIPILMLFFSSCATHHSSVSISGEGADSGEWNVYDFDPDSMSTCVEKFTRDVNEKLSSLSLDKQKRIVLLIKEPGVMPGCPRSFTDYTIVFSQIQNKLIRRRNDIVSFIEESEYNPATDKSKIDYFLKGLLFEQLSSDAIRRYNRIYARYKLIDAKSKEIVWSQDYSVNKKQAKLSIWDR